MCVWGERLLSLQVLLPKLNFSSLYYKPQQKQNAKNEHPPTSPLQARS